LVTPLDCFDFSAVRFDDTASNRHAKPGSFRFRCEKWFKDATGGFRTQAGPVVAVSDFDGWPAFQVYVTASDLDDHRIPTGRQRILHHIAKQLHDAKTVDCCLELGLVTRLNKRRITAATRRFQ
jgi:hypothetical protein